MQRQLFIFLAHELEAPCDPHTATISLIAAESLGGAVNKVEEILAQSEKKHVCYSKGLVSREELVKIMNIQTVILQAPAEEKPMDYEKLGQLLFDNPDKHSWVLSKKV